MTPSLVHIRRTVLHKAVVSTTVKPRHREQSDLDA
jgi:hypothetical protein